jgi:hypothetical protein
MTLTYFPYYEQINEAYDIALLPVCHPVNFVIHWLGKDVPSVMNTNNNRITVDCGVFSMVRVVPNTFM